MQLNLSRLPVPLPVAYKLQTQLGLDVDLRFLKTPEYIFHVLLNHGSPIGLVWFFVRCKPYSLDVWYTIKSIFEDRVSEEDVADLLLRKYRPVFVAISKIHRHQNPLQCKLRSPRDKPFVAILIEDPKGYCLVPWRCDFCKWSVITGGIEENEQPLQAAKRECYEELGIYPELTRWFVFTTPRNNLAYVYRGKIHSWDIISNKDFNVQPVLNLIHKNHLRLLRRRSLALDKIVRHL